MAEEQLSGLRERILDRVETLRKHPPWQGQKEPYLAHLKLGHRRLIEGSYKIIYRIADELIYVTDIFDSRQDPRNMRG